MRAAENGHAETVRFLLQNGAGAEDRDIEGDTALLYAVRRGRAEVAALLLSGSRPDAVLLNRALTLAARRGEVPMLRLLLDAGAAVDARDAGGRSALALAAAEGHPEAARTLLAGGADPNAADADGATPLMLAAYYGHADIVHLLLTHGADPSARDASGDSARDYARRPEILRLLPPR